MCRSGQRRERLTRLGVAAAYAQAPLGPIVRSLTSSGVLSRMSCAYLRSILSSLACVARRVDRVREPPWIPSPRLCSQVEGPSRTRTRNLRVEERVDLPRFHTSS